MSDEQHPLERLSRRGEERGAEAVLADARAESASPSVGGRVLAGVAAVVVLVGAVAGVVALTRDDDGASLETVDQPEVPSPGGTAPDRAASDTTTRPAGAPDDVFFAFEIPGPGVVKVSGLGEGDGALSVEPLEAELGQEGSTDMAVSADGSTAFHTIVQTGCLANVVESRVGSGSVATIQNAAHPAIDWMGRLAYATGEGCTTEAGTLTVRDTATGEEVSVLVDGEELGVPHVIVDVAWFGEWVAVLTSQVDAAGVDHRTVILYEVPADGPPAEADRIPLDSLFPGVTVTEIGQVYGEPGMLGYAWQESPGGAGAIGTLDLDEGNAREDRIRVQVPVQSFAFRALDDLLYVASQPKVPGESPVVDELRHRTPEGDVLVAEGLNSVAVPAWP